MFKGNIQTALNFININIYNSFDWYEMVEYLEYFKSLQLSIFFCSASFPLQLLSSSGGVAKCIAN